MTVRGGGAASPVQRYGSYALVGGEKVLRIPVGILVSGLASRALGVEGFGSFSSVIVLLTVLSPLASFGLESLGIAIASRSRGFGAYFRSVGPFRLLTGLGAGVLFLAASIAYVRPDANDIPVYALYALSTVLLLRIYELGENVLFAREQLATLAAVRMAAFLGANAVIVGALLLAPSLSLLLVLSAAEAALLLVTYSWLFRTEIRAAVSLPGGSGEIRTAMAQCRAAWPVFLSGLLVLVLLNADKLLVYRIMGRADAGLYGAAAKLVDVLYFIPMVIGTTHAASFARLAQDGDLMSGYRAALKTATTLSAFAAAGLALLSWLIMPLVYGEPFAEASRALTLLAPCLVAVTWVSLRTRALAAMEQRRVILHLTIIALLIHVPVLAIGLIIGSIEAVAFCQMVGWFAAAIVAPMFSPAAGAFSPVQILWKAR